VSVISTVYGEMQPQFGLVKKRLTGFVHCILIQKRSTGSRW
jgi:hypothetical protein